MSDRERPAGGRPEEGTPEYDWLYGARGRPPAADDEATQVMPSEPRPQQPTAPPAGGYQGPRQPNVPPPAVPPPRPAQQYPAQQYPAQPYPVQPSPAGPPGGPPGGPGRFGRSGSGSGRRRPRVKTIFRVILALLVLWIVFLIAVPFIALNNVDRVNPFPKNGRPAETDGTTYLVVGSDKADDLTKEQRKELDTPERSGSRTDTMMLVHVGGGPTVVMSLPRDTLVEIPGHGTGQLNAAFSYGKAKLLVQTVEGFTGVRVDHYVEVGFGSIINTVDALGGIEVCPKQAFNDPKARLKIKKGCQEVDGMTALAYSRTRATARADLDRVGRQREVVSALGDKVVSPWTVLIPWRYWNFNMAAAGAVRADEDLGVVGFARLARGMTGEQKSCTLPIAPAPSDPNRLVVDDGRAKKLFAAIKDNDTSSIPKSVCTVTGLAGVG